RPNRSKMARPMPRLAPVTSAALRSVSATSDPCDGRIEWSDVADRECRYRLVDAPDQCRQDLARATFDEGRCTARNHRSDALRPANGIRELRDQVSTNS